MVGGIPKISCLGTYKTAPRLWTLSLAIPTDITFPRLALLLIPSPTSISPIYSISIQLIHPNSSSKMTASLISINKLAHTRVLILGGTSGIGFCVARAALEHGANIIIASSNSDKVASTIARLQTLYPTPEYTERIAGQACDLGDQDTVETNLLALLEYATSPSLFPNTPTTEDTTVKESEKVLLNHIIYPSGTSPPRTPITSPTITATSLTTSPHTTLRLIAPLLIGKHTKTYLHDTSTSSLTFTSGVLAARPIAGLALGGAAMGTALEGLTRGLAVELAPIRVNVVAPGAVETEIFDRLGGGEEVKEMYLGAFRRGTLVGEVGRPEDVAEAYLWCMKDGFVTGQRVGSDGGALLKGV
ncbi:oxidoreductase, short chain dehydrogenase/reductase family [Aspergillus ibericus CBS 121593]|uniref:NAD(P)-binding protein n=1 Tax=Aspergillus ibericus CBS 121593 TaxID=1448316 RepID=A0A395H9I0_9EURO|nr:NAD(P)-binding protein [Aspergillus ibericus CBS 121593]RAL03548.1 NAD(P)-binding protein [Aspergillus ibericus CBS 121593]